MTPANWLTLLRIAFVPLFVILILKAQVTAALVVFCLAALTDSLDGLVARRFGQPTPLGTVLDPAADKLLLTSAFVVLSLDHLPLTATIPLWLTWTVISRDLVLVVGAAAVYVLVGRRLFPPSLYGKITTFFQAATVAAVLLANVSATWGDWLSILFYATLALTLFSGLHYLTRELRIFFLQRKESV